MLDEEKIVDVVNFSGMSVAYSVPELHVSRSFVPWEKKKIPTKEIIALSYIPGGRELIKNMLSVHDEEILDEIGLSVEPEYYWTQEDVKDMLLNGSVERLQDCLDFAPKGIVNNVKDLAVELEISDMNKRQAIQDKTHFNVTSAINFKKADEEAAAEAQQETQKETPKRRVPVK